MLLSLPSHAHYLSAFLKQCRDSLRSFVALSFISSLIACGGGGGGGGVNAPDPVAITPPPGNDQNNNQNANNLDAQLRMLIDEAGLLGDASFNRTLPSINDPLAQLGMKLFFSKSLGGDFDAACVSCHHPSLGGADALTLPIGVGAENPDLLGPGRIHLADGIPNVPRNSPTIFNLGLWDSGMFWDSRVESFGKEEFANGTVSDIRTPDVAFGNADPNAGDSLPTAQARFPITSAEEMRGATFEAGNDNAAVRSHLAARLGNYGVGVDELTTNEWLVEFQAGFESTADARTLITEQNIAAALAAYERSMVFTRNPFAAYVEGDLAALTDEQKQGAILFFTPATDGGGNCSQCHAGDKFTDELHHTVAFPQFGHGKGDGIDDDFGRERETSNIEDRYRFRTPSLLNVAVTAPYGHAGTYESLNQVLQHYDDPVDTVDDFFDDGGACTLNQFENITDCATLYPNAATNSEAALEKLDDERDAGTSEFPNLNLNNNERQQIVAFLESLTDPCVLDRTCLSPWIPDTSDNGPDGLQLNGIDDDGDLL
ncbi:MAG: cytochrome c peroxidase [Pseudomonadota bacterium]